jgi:hypothetical protein
MKFGVWNLGPEELQAEFYISPGTRKKMPCAGLISDGPEQARLSERRQIRDRGDL